MIGSAAMADKILKTRSRRCLVLVIFQDVIAQAISNPTRMIGQFLSSDETLLKKRKQ